MIDLTTVAVPASMRRLSPLLPAAPASILEVGCGNGALAAELGRRGYTVTGAEPSPEAAHSARTRGVRVLESRVEDLDQPEQGYDVVLFTRSLHHVEDLKVTVDAAARQLRPGGTILLEEFATDGITAAGAAFLYDTLELLGAAGLADTSSPHHHHEGHGETPASAPADPLERWHHERGGLKTRPEMLAALGERATLGPITDTETLWRIIASRISGPDRARAERMARLLEAAEIRRIEQGELPALGFVVSARV